VKCLKILLYFCFAALISLKFWSNYGHIKSIKALYSSRFNFLIYHFGYIYCQRKKRLAGGWERNCLCERSSEPSPRYPPTVIGYRQTQRARKWKKHRAQGRTKKAFGRVDQYWPVIEKRLGYQPGCGSGYYIRCLPVPFPRNTQPRTYLAWYWDLRYLVNTLLASY
jgi:hypothetical protein